MVHRGRRVCVSLSIVSRPELLALAAHSYGNSKDMSGISQNREFRPSYVSQLPMRACRKGKRQLRNATGGKPLVRFGLANGLRYLPVAGSSQRPPAGPGDPLAPSAARPGKSSAIPLQQHHAAHHRHQHHRRRRSCQRHLLSQSVLAGSFIEHRVENLTAQAQIIANAIAQLSKLPAEASAEKAQAGDENKIVAQSGLVQPGAVVPGRSGSRLAHAKRTGGADKNAGANFRHGRHADLGQPAAFRVNGRTPRAARPRKAAPIFSASSGPISEKSSGQPDLPLYKDMGVDGKAYDEVRVALAGSVMPIIRVTESARPSFQSPPRSSAIIRCWARFF